MKELTPYLPFLIPLVIAELILLVTALVHVLKHQKFRFGNKIMWIVIVVCLQIIGPVIYFAFGQDPDRSDD